MPRPNNRSYNNSNDNSKSYGKSSNSRKSFKSNNTRASKFGADRFNMLNFGQAFLDETPDAKYMFKARVLLKTKDGELADVVDGDGKGDNVYTPEESAMLIAKALLEGRAINICFFEQEDGWSGNARIDIKDIDSDAEDDQEEEAPPKTKVKPKTTKAKVKAKPKFEVPEDADEDDDDEEETVVDEADEEDLPY